MNAIYEMEETPLTTDAVVDDLKEGLLAVTFTNKDGGPVYPIKTGKKGNNIVLEMSDGTSFTLSCACINTP